MKRLKILSKTPASYIGHAILEINSAIDSGHSKISIQELAKSLENGTLFTLLKDKCDFDDSLFSKEDKEYFLRNLRDLYSVMPVPNRKILARNNGLCVLVEYLLTLYDRSLGTVGRINAWDVDDYNESQRRKTKGRSKR
jgi:hypothetical protein